MISLIRLCVTREFTCLSTNRPSRIANWLRALCRKIKAECGGRGVGAIGMCMTGNIIISLMLDDSVMAPVISQPSLPIWNIGFPGLASKEARKRALAVPDEDLKLAAERAKASNVPLLASARRRPRHPGAPARRRGPAHRRVRRRGPEGRRPGRQPAVAHQHRPGLHEHGTGVGVGAHLAVPGPADLAFRDAVGA